MRGIAVFCLVVLLLLDILSGVLSEGSTLRKSRVRRVDDATSGVVSASYVQQNDNTVQVVPVATTASVIKTYVHVVYSTTDSRTNVPDKKINDQMDVLNNAFKGNLMNYTDCDGTFKKSGIEVPFQFSLQNIDRTWNNYWHNSTMLNYSEMTKALRTGSCADLHIFITGGGMGDDIHGKRGYGSDPSKCSESTISDDFVAVRWDTLPDDTISGQYNKGFTLVHHVGHWLGLYDTFYGGCGGSGDFVSDTPAEASGADLCTLGRDTCPGVPGYDPVTNFMDTSYDCCLNYFTLGQKDRMVQQGQNFRFKGGASVLNGDASDINGVASVLSEGAPASDINGASVPAWMPPAPTASSQCQLDQWFTDVVVTTQDPEHTEFFIVSLPQDPTANSGMSWNPPMTPRIQGDPGEQNIETLMHHVCLNDNDENILVVIDSTGQSFVHGSWKLKVDGQKIPTPKKMTDKYFQLHQILNNDGVVPTRDCPSGTLFTLLLQLRDKPKQTSWTLDWLTGWGSFVSVAATDSYIGADAHKLFLWDECLEPPSSKAKRLRFTITDNDGLCHKGSVGFYAVYYGGKLLKSGCAFGKSYPPIDWKA